MSKQKDNGILEELKTTNKILVLFLLKNENKTAEKDKIGFLNKSGFSDKEISNLLGKTQQNITTTLGKIEKKKTT